MLLEFVLKAGQFQVCHCTRLLSPQLEKEERMSLVESTFPGLKLWVEPQEFTVDQSVIDACGSEILAKLLMLRGVKTAKDVAVFLDPLQYTPSDPMCFADMPAAIARIAEAIDSKEKIIVYGDYDVDGVTGTCVLLTTLRKLGANVDYYIPNRANEGYGLNLQAVTVLASKHRAKLIITCDCGVSNFAEINLAKGLGVDTIVVDHHALPDMMPPAIAVLHPKQLAPEHPLFDLSGVGMAYKLCEALLIERGLDAQVSELHDLVTLGLIADMVPLIRENRYLVQIGLRALQNTNRPGLRALMGQSPQGEGTDQVGFGIAPRINAVGRLSDARAAVELLTTEDELLAAELAQKLDLENARRQELCEQIFELADRKAKDVLLAGNTGAIAIYDEGWHHGVVGIVASRLVEKYHRPVFIGELDPDSKLVKGSARGIVGIDLYAALKANEGLLAKWGGHQMAAGFSCEQSKADVFCQAISETCAKMLGGAASKDTLEIDLRVEAKALNLPFVRDILRISPFGIGNKKPIFLLESLSVASVRSLGKEGKHHRLILTPADTNDQLECVYWRSGLVPKPGDLIDLCFSAEINTYNGSERLQLVLRDWRTRGCKQNSEANFAKPEQQIAADKTETRSISASSHDSEVEPIMKSKPLSEGVASENCLDDVQTIQSVTVNWRDLRAHGKPEAIIEAAVRKLGNRVSIFAEAQPKNCPFTCADRVSLIDTSHLIIWQYPPNLQVFKGILSRSAARNIYLVGGAIWEEHDPAGFLKKLLAIVRFAVNQKEGQAEPDKIAAALSTNKVAVALGLTILKKLHVVDWFAEDGFIYLDLVGQPEKRAEELAEFKQLAVCLKEISDFRSWCSGATFKELQLALMPNALLTLGRQETMGDNQAPVMLDGMQAVQTPG